MPNYKNFIRYQRENADDLIVSRRAVTILNNDQIKALPDDTVELVPAPGPGLAIDFVRIQISSKIVGSYTNVSSESYITFSWESGPDAAHLYQADTYYSSDLVAGLLTANGGFVAVSPPLDVGNADLGSQPTKVVDPNDVGNVAFVMDMNNGLGSPALTGGDPLNTMKIAVIYFVVEV